MKIPQNYKSYSIQNNSNTGNQIVDNIKNLFHNVSNDNTLTESDKVAIHSFLIETMNHFSEYVQETNNYVFVVQSISELRLTDSISQEEFERQLKNVDLTRRNKHNIAIDACNQLNRQCDFYHIDKICDIDTTNRLQVADFAAKFAMAVHGYAVDHNYTMDEVLSKMNKDPHLLNTDMIDFDERE